MKTTLSIILLSLLLTTGLVSCSQSENAKEIQEIEESISANEDAQMREKGLAYINQRTAEFEERMKINNEKMASTPEGREYMEKCLLRWKHTFVENGHISLKLTRKGAEKLGFSSKEYDEILSLSMIL